MTTALHPDDDELTAQLRSSLTGDLLLPGDPGYDETRQVHNGLINKRPAVIVRCLSTADVVDAVRFGRTKSLEIAVRGGGHNVAGRATVDGGLMIDLAPMKGIHVDPQGRSARAQPGLTWKEFNRATQLHGLAVTGGVIPSTGIAGLTLGGGLGWLMGRYGMAVDNLLSVELVTAGGDVVTASEQSNADLFWGVRGGGGNLGVVTSLEYRLHPVGPVVHGGLIAWALTDATKVLQFYRQFTASLPDDLTAFAVLAHAPDGVTPIVAIALCHCGSTEQAERDLAPVAAFGSPLESHLGPIPYSVLNGMLDAGFPRGALNYWKANFLKELTDDVIETLVDRYSACPSTMSALVLEHFHGQVTRVPVEAMAYPHRTTGYNLAIAGEWLDPGATDQNVKWVRDTYRALEPSMADSRYVNYMAEDEGADQTRRAYGPNFDRLRLVKAKWDPENIFHINQNVAPT